ncbi:MAG: 3-keto-disaccharide hydrolase [Chitinophagaceae bacterium]
MTIQSSNVFPQPWRRCVAFAAGLALSHAAAAQDPLPLQDLSYFKTPAASWSVAGGVKADLTKRGALILSPGTGILVNNPVGNNGVDLFSNMEHGDVDIELEYLMAKGSNSGIYLQGRYEMQLLDSWGVTTPRAGDNGGMYQRWDDSKPEGQKGFEGTAPRQNATKAPGLWQKLKISFQAPRFNAAGQKVENARIVRAELNGVLIHEDVELTGPTRGAVSNTEAATGPLRIQGDHGAIAFRNIKITPFGKPRPQLSNINYTVYKGRYYDTLNISKLPPEAKGPLGNLTAGALAGLPNQYFINYTGTLKVTEPGIYHFNAAVPGGNGTVKIGGKAVGRQGVQLSAGDHPFELLYTKNQDWSNRSLALTVSGPGIRPFVIGDVITEGNNVDPILVDAPSNTLLRSFMDIPGKRVVHAVSFGSPQQVHYTYDMDHGALVQVWRGGFLDATPMWYSRGDGSSRPRGAVQRFGMPVLALAQLASADAPWLKDTVGTGYTPKGYKLNRQDEPTFMYTLYGASVADAVRALPSGDGIEREITVQNGGEGLYARLAESKHIEQANNGWYLVDGSYYIRLDDAGGAKASIRNGANGGQELVVPVQGKLRYSILF